MSEEKHKRPSWDEYFMNLVKTVGERGTCDRGRSGCVVVKDKQILVTGYVGSPIGFEHCDDVGHKIKTLRHEDGRETKHCTRTVHAEQNAICQAARRGIPLDGSAIYANMMPCRTCAMILVNSGIKRIVCGKKYHAGEESEEIFKTAKVPFEYMEEGFVEYDEQ